MAILPINQDKCTGCNRCVDACPMDVIRRDFDQPEVPPCTNACPAGIDMRGYLRLMNLGRYEEAYSLVRQTNPLFALTGYVCYAPCEQACARAFVDEAVHINGVERFLGQYMLSQPPVPARRIYAQSVAVIGSGPAGVAAAYDLVNRGYAVTVFERDAHPGGMVRKAIPEYRMPTDKVDEQMEWIRAVGVEFRTNVTFGMDVDLPGLWDQGYGAVFIATGAPISKVPDLPGVDKAGVHQALEFLLDAKAGVPVQLGRGTLVVGGGDVAVDCALTARRLGCRDVTIVYRRTRQEMQAVKVEAGYAVEEGTVIECSWAPKAVLGTGHVSDVEFMYSVPNVNLLGASELVLEPDNTRTFPADSVIFALGAHSDPAVSPAITDHLTLQTATPGVFSAEVCDSVVEAIAQGKRAAESIDRYLRGQDLAAGRGQIRPKVKHPPVAGIVAKPRQDGAILGVTERVSGFPLIEAGLAQQAIDLEVDRCMGCGSKAYVKYLDDCQVCDACEWECQYDAIYVSPEKTEPLMVTFK